MQHHCERLLKCVNMGLQNMTIKEGLPWASVAKEDSSQYMYDCDSGPVVCTKK
jgi:hypothetical protein